MSRSEHFQHQPIDTSKEQIRLLHVHYKLPLSKTVRCSIETFDLASCPPFRALSYVWGSRSPTRLILVEGKPFAIRDNLYHFLKVFQGKLESGKYIWIDQLCIKQADSTERNHQVSMMNQIYRQAIEVLVWLGPEEDQSDAVIKHIRDWFPVRRRSLIPYTQPFDPRLQIPESDLPQSAFIKLLSRPYFSRLWIVQEILLARRTRILCGSRWMELSQLRDFCDAFVYHDRGSAMSVRHAANLLHLSRREFSSTTHTLPELIIHFSNNQCGDPRDKVYGLLGLIDSQYRPEIDYRKSTEEVFFDTAKAVFNHMGSSGYRGVHPDILFLLWTRMGLRGCRGIDTEKRLAEFLGVVHRVAQEKRISCIGLRECSDGATVSVTKAGEFWCETI